MTTEPPVPSAQVLDLFRALEDIHELTAAVVVLLTDDRGVSVAVAGDEDEIPAPLRALLGGAKLAEAGSVRGLLEPVGEVLAGWPLNVSLFPVGGGHLLTIAFDAEADLETVQALGREGTALLGEILMS